MSQQGAESPASLRLSCSPGVAAVLRAASLLEDLPEDFRAEAQRSASGGDVSWRLLRRACRALRDSGSEAGEAAGPWLQTLARSGGLRLEPPRLSRPHSSELERRREQLRLQAQEREYQVLVRDITRAERAEQERVPVNATMREMGFGMHVITVMASCFLAALALGRRLFSEPGLQIVVGAIGMLIALLVETGLFVIQDTRAHEREQRAKQKKQ